MGVVERGAGAVAQTSVIACADRAQALASGAARPTKIVGAALKCHGVSGFAASRPRRGLFSRRHGVIRRRPCYGAIMTRVDSLTLRLAVEADLPALRTLMDLAIGQLMAGFLTAEEVAASFSIMGLDTQLVADRTYFVVEDGARVAGCGGWSRRATLFGGDHTAGRDAALLDPATDAARVRAMYTHPDFVRRGVGRMILDACEAAAAAEGFGRCELAATMAGEPLYLACGYREIERFREPTPQGVHVPLVRMGKSLISPV
jgi:GNAT superfamily N-acetyltransferase